MKSNFNSENLLCNCKIVIIGKHNEKYVMMLPTVEDKLTEMDFDIFVGFCGGDLKDIAKQTGISFESKFELFKFYKNNKVNIMPVLDHFFKKYMIGFHYVDDALYWGSRLVSKQMFEIFCNYFAIASGVMSIDSLKWIITDDMTEEEKRMAVYEKKIAKTKSKGNSEGKNISFDIILTGVCYEYGYTFDQLLKMSLYSIYFMYSQVHKIMTYDVNIVAAGFGNLKRHTKLSHWTNSK